MNSTPPIAKEFLDKRLSRLRHFLGKALQMWTREVDPDDAADAGVFLSTASLALKYDDKLTDDELAMISLSLDAARRRIDALNHGEAPWRSQRGRHALGYRSRVDNSIQPFGVVVPETYNPARPHRLDVVLHGSVRVRPLMPLTFINWFEESLDRAPRQPNPITHDWIEMYPFGRAENCYRWAGETDIFEAIDATCRRYNIDRDRVVLRGLSMGASGTWHVGLKHPGEFAALGPWCGYVDTYEFSHMPCHSFPRVEKLPPLQESLLHLNDAQDYVRNALTIPPIAAMGADDQFFDAHEYMRRVMKKEGVRMMNLVAPKTGHAIEPKTHAVQMKKIDRYVKQGRRPTRGEVVFTTWSLRYGRCHWLQLLGLGKHYERARFEAKRVKPGVIRVSRLENVTRFAIANEGWGGAAREIWIGGKRVRVESSPSPFLGRGQGEGLRPSSPTSSRSENKKTLSKTLTLPSPGGRGEEKTLTPALSLRRAREQEKTVLVRRGAAWVQQTAPPGGFAKSPGMQGPIDDAFLDSFLCVRGTGKPWFPRVNAWANARLDDFAKTWAIYQRGELQIVDDANVTPEQVATRSLVLFGDPGSNAWIARALTAFARRKHQPLAWTRRELKLARKSYAPAAHVPMLIHPSPLDGAAGRYVVFNTGHTFGGKEFGTINYLLFPRLGDWAIAEAAGDASDTSRAVATGFFNERWR